MLFLFRSIKQKQSINTQLPAAIYIYLYMYLFISDLLLSESESVFSLSLSFFFFFFFFFFAASGLPGLPYDKSRGEIRGEDAVTIVPVPQSYLIICFKILFVSIIYTYKFNVLELKYMYLEIYIYSSDSI